MGDRRSTEPKLGRPPKCAHVKASSCRCTGNGLPPGENEVPVKRNPEFTMEQLVEMTRVPVTRIFVDEIVSRAQLQGHYNKIIRRACKEAIEFVANKPVLPQQNSPACIDLLTKDNEREIVKLCFDMRSLYSRGVLVGGQFYELRISEDRDSIVFVEGSIPLECMETYDKMLGSHNPSVELSPGDFDRGFKSFIKLHPEQRNTFPKAARSIALISLMLLEPSRQEYMMSMMCSGKSIPQVYYFKMDEDAWKSVHGWGSRSKKAKGIEYEGETVIEKVYPVERTLAIQELNIINSTKLLPVKRLTGPQQTIFFYEVSDTEENVIEEESQE